MTKIFSVKEMKEFLNNHNDEELVYIYGGEDSDGEFVGMDIKDDEIFYEQ